MSQTKVVEKTETHIYVQLLYFENSAFYEIMWKNMVERDRSQIKIWRMPIACWLPKVTNTHSEYVMLTSFPRQRRLRERASTSLYTYIACLVVLYCVYISKARAT